MRKLVIITAILILTGCIQQQNNVVKRKQPDLTKPTIQEEVVESKFVFPVAEFFQRITKKQFGIYITPSDSPVQPERFSGYHTGVDVEYEDVTGEVPVYAIADGILVYNGIVSGYGGVMAIKHQIDGVEYIAVYGHLKPSSIKDKYDITKGEQIAVLGKGFSSEIDGERKHLHFALYRGEKLNLKGYVQKESDLSAWADPREVLK